jgi:hypothetical protein
MALWGERGPLRIIIIIIKLKVWLHPNGTVCAHTDAIKAKVLPAIAVPRLRLILRPPTQHTTCSSATVAPLRATSKLLVLQTLLQQHTYAAIAQHSAGQHTTAHQSTAQPDPQALTHHENTSGSAASNMTTSGPSSAMAVATISVRGAYTCSVMPSLSIMISSTPWCREKEGKVGVH